VSHATTHSITQKMLTAAPKRMQLIRAVPQTNYAAALTAKPSACMIGIGCGLLQSGVGRNHFSRDQVLPDADVLKRTLDLCAPRLICRHVNFAEAVRFLSKIRF
jgi:hypothetical protein